LDRNDRVAEPPSGLRIEGVAIADAIAILKGLA